MASKPFALVAKGQEMRIAIFTDLYLEAIGGIASSIAAQKSALEKLGYTVTVFCPGRACSEKDVVLLPTSWLKINGAPMGKRPSVMLKFLAEKYPDFGADFDVVHVHYEAEVSILGVMMAKKYHLPLVQTMHGREDMAVQINIPFGFKTLAGTLLNGLHHRLLKPYSKSKIVKKDQYLARSLAQAKMWELMVRQANAADLVLTPSKHFGEKLKHYGVVKEIKTLSNGVADELVEAIEWPVRKMGDKLNIVSTARVSKEKRIIPFLEALVELRKYTDKFFLTVIGDGNELKEAERFVQKNELVDNVEFAGKLSREEVIQNLKEQDVSVTNSYGFDTQGLTLLEAVATGLPVIYADPDMDEVIPRGTGLRAEDKTPAKMAELLKTLIDNPKIIEKMSEEAFAKRKEVLQSSQITELVSIYSELQ